MTKKRTAFFTLITASLAVMANHAHAQYAPAGQTASAKEAPRMSFEDKLASVTGSRYWIVSVGSAPSIFESCILP